MNKNISNHSNNKKCKNKLKNHINVLMRKKVTNYIKLSLYKST